MRPEEIKFLVVHTSATRPSVDIDVIEIDRWHRARGWDGIGYHYVIRRDGWVELGRLPDVIGAHVKGFNHCSLGICLVGGLNEVTAEPQDNYTGRQKVRLEALLRYLKHAYPHAYILGHRDFPDVKKACPCFDVRDWLTRFDDSSFFLTGTAPVP